MAPLAHQVVPGLRRYAYGRLRVPAAKLYASAVAPALERHARSADLVHMWGGDLLAAAAVHAAARAGVPSVVTPFAHPLQYGTGPADALAYPAADRVVALLDADAAVYQRMGVPPARIDVSGVGSPGVAAGGGAALRRRVGVKGPLVLFLGVRRPYKGYPSLLEAAPRVRAERPDVSFVFVGLATRSSRRRASSTRAASPTRNEPRDSRRRTSSAFRPRQRSTRCRSSRRGASGRRFSEARYRP